MARDLTPAMDAELVKAVKRPFLLSKIQTSEGPLLAWTGYGNLTFNSEVYLGVGRYGGVGTVEESSNLQPNGVAFSLSGIPSSYIAITVGKIKQGMDAFAWLGFWDSSLNQPVDSPYQIFRGLTDIPIINEDSNTSKITIECVNRLARLKIAKIFSYTTEDQKLIDPTDLGFFQVAALQEFKYEPGPRDNDEANLFVETQ